GTASSGGGSSSSGGGGAFDAGQLTPGWVAIPPGQFGMGSPVGEPCRDPNTETVHFVNLTRGYEMAPMETTQAEFQALMGFNPSNNTTCGTDCPVESVTWHQAAAYCSALSRQKGYAECYACDGGVSLDGGKSSADCAVAAGSIYACKGYRLPTEAEFEMAYRAVTTTAFYNGDLAPGPDGGCASTTDPNADAIGWHLRNSNVKIHPVGQKLANGFGLYDLGGNVAEHVHDYYLADLGSSSVTDPVTTSGTTGVIRGGNFANPPSAIRGAYRQTDPRTFVGTGIGFRCVRTLP
ncbi:MAG: formylglycine-generating enzyme family protein, partial [Myxococcaceae bacterium]|nr:formylglycine-generating enzyme family protein [Myxococcaceae bacterium]